MARKYIKSNGTAVASFGASFSYSSAIPIDNRFVVADKENLIASATWITNGVNAAYKGLQVYVESESSVYVLTANDPTVSANWKKIATADTVVGGTNYKGVKTDLTALNGVSNPVGGDMYYITHAVESGATVYESADGAFYIFNGTSWDKINKEDVAHATTAGTADKLTNARNINGLAFDGSKAVSNFFTCTTNTDVANKEATLTDITAEEGTVIRIKFANENTAASPTLNGVALKRGNTPFDKWEAGAIVTFTYVGSGNNASWQAHEVNGIDVIADNFTKANFATLDFDNADFENSNEINGDSSEGYSPAPRYFGQQHFTSQQEHDFISPLVDKLLTLADSPDGKLHFILFKGKRCKFDIDEYSNTSSEQSVKFSFFYTSCSVTSGNQQPTLNPRMVTIEIILTSSDVKFHYQYKDLGGGGGTIDTSTLATKTSVNALSNRVTAIEESYKWVDLDLLASN